MDTSVKLGICRVCCALSATFAFIPVYNGNFQFCSLRFRITKATVGQVSSLQKTESHGDLARPLAGAQGRVRSERLWVDLTNLLNAVGGGVSKTTEKWKKASTFYIYT
ncbi:hypothetical protein ACJJTC_014521 [Scirpophaga incertulas]